MLQSLVELVAPPRCAACDCAAPLVQGLFCTACDLSVERFVGKGGAFQYGGPVADAVRRFKYERRSELGAPLGRCLAAELHDTDQEFDAVVPVPLHWRRRRARGYDQAALLCGPIGRALGVPVRISWLRRVRDTAPQADLGRAERLRNLHDAFVAKNLADGPRVLLIDDVRTTGATLGAASEALHRAGASSVQSQVLAIRVLEPTT